MEILKDPKDIDSLRKELIHFLNQYKMNGQAIMTIARTAEAVVFPAGHVIFQQNTRSDFIYFLVRGSIQVRIKDGDTERVVGERAAISPLGEIAFFNDTPASATVEISSKEPGHLFRLSYHSFRQIVSNNPDVKKTLAQIGDIRLLLQNRGFAKFNFFMEMIGWPKNRFGLGMAQLAEFEKLLEKELLSSVGKGKHILEVGDGPGFFSEIIHDLQPHRLNDLFIHANHLEEAVYTPEKPFGSNLTNAWEIHEKFGGIIAFQVFNVVKPELVPGHFETAAKLLEAGGTLLIIKNQLLDVRHGAEASEAELIFNVLGGVIERIWPGGLEGPLVKIDFIDAALDPLMEWNLKFSENIKDIDPEIPSDLPEEEKILLEELFSQVKNKTFLPDSLFSKWLIWKGTQNGFSLKEYGINQESGVMFHTFQKSK